MRDEVRGDLLHDVLSMVFETTKLTHYQQEDVDRHREDSDGKVACPPE